MWLAFDVGYMHKRCWKGPQAQVQTPAPSLSSIYRHESHLTLLSHSAVTYKLAGITTSS